MERRIESLRDHFIICAYGRVGKQIARELEGEGVPYGVIDRKEPKLRRPAVSARRDSGPAQTEKPNETVTHVSG